MRVGVVGAGYWGSKHVRVLHSVEQVTQVYVIDADPSRRESIAKAFPTTIGFASLTEAIDEVDAVVIATPPITHAPLALQAIEAGKHVLVEKPLATTAIDAWTLTEAARRNGVVLMNGHTFEYNAAVVRLREIVQSGRLGDIFYIDSARLNLGLYQGDVNVLWDLAPHDISICNYVLGQLPVSVTVWGAAHAHREFEDVASIRLEYADPDVTATIRVSWLDPCKVRQTTVVGSKMMAVYDDMNANERLKLYDCGVDIGGTMDANAHAMPTTYRYGDIVAPHVEFNEPLLEEDRDFVRSALAGGKPRASAEKGAAIVEILEAANRSLVEEVSVPLDLSVTTIDRGPSIIHLP